MDADYVMFPLLSNFIFVPAYNAGSIYFQIKLISSCISSLFAVTVITASFSGKMMMNCP